MNAARAVTVGEKEPAEFLVIVTPGLRYLNFTATGPIPAVKILAQDIQNQLGHMAPGYGAPELMQHEALAGGTYASRWRCREN